MTNSESIPAGRGGSIYEVTLLRKGVDPRTATDADFQIVRIVAANSINAQIRARNQFDAALAFDARKVES